MRLLLIENPQRVAWLNKMLAPTISDEKRRLVAINALIEADPTSAKKLAQWLCKLAMKRIISINGAIQASADTQIRLPEDSQRVQDVLSTFERAKPRLPQDRRDLNGYRDFYSLEDTVTQAVNTGVSKAGAVIKQVPGARVVFNSPPYVMYKVDKVNDLDGSGKYSTEELERIKAVGVLGMGPPETKWCTRGRYGMGFATSYLKKRDIYVLYKDGVPFIQRCGKVVMDVNDRRTEMPPEIAAYFEEEGKRARLAMRSMVDKAKAMGIKVAVLADKIIPFDAVADAGGYYYLGIGKLKQPRRGIRTNKRKTQAILDNNLGVLERQERLVRNYDNGDYESSKRQEMIIYWWYETILTVGKNNVEIVDGSVPPIPEHRSSRYRLGPGPSGPKLVPSPTLRSRPNNQNSWG